MKRTAIIALAALLLLAACSAGPATERLATRWASSILRQVIPIAVSSASNERCWGSGEGAAEISREVIVVPPKASTVADKKAVKPRKASGDEPRQSRPTVARVRRAVPAPAVFTLASSIITEIPPAPAATVCPKKLKEQHRFVHVATRAQETFTFEVVSSPEPLPAPAPTLRTSS
jgi:hypothetical protein